MPIVETRTRIETPPSVVEAVLLDAELAPAWTTGLEKLEVVAGEPGKAGCVGHAHYLQGRRRYVLEDVLEEVKPGCYYRSRITGGGIAVTVETTLEPADDGKATELMVRWKGTGTTPATRLLLPLMRRRIVRGAAADLDKLRRLAESRSV